MGGGCSEAQNLCSPAREVLVLQQESVVTGHATFRFETIVQAMPYPSTDRVDKIRKSSNDQEEAETQEALDMNAISLMAIIKGVDDVYYRFDTFDTRDGFVVARRQPVTRQPRSHDNFGGGGYVSDMVRKVSETMKHFRALDLYCGGVGESVPPKYSQFIAEEVLRRLKGWQ